MLPGLAPSWDRVSEVVVVSVSGPLDKTLQGFLNSAACAVLAVSSCQVVAVACR